MSASVAARTAASGKRWLPGQMPLAATGLSVTGSPSIDGGTGDLIGLTVEIFINSAWTDITSFVYYRGNVGVTITRGRADETAQIQPQTAKLILNNRDGRFSSRNPSGPYYGQLGRNTPLRVSRLANGIRRYRFYGEVPAWPTASDVSGKDVTVTITASGMLRRLRAGNQPLRSAMFRAFTIGYIGVTNPDGSATAGPVAYWPCEDGASATQIASGLNGGTAMTVSGTPTFANSSAFPGSAALPQLNGSTWTGTVSPASSATANEMWLLVSVPSGGDVNGGVVARMMTTGTIARVDLVYTTASGGTLTMYGYDAANNQLFASSSFAAMTGVNGAPQAFEMDLTVSGGTVTWESSLFPLSDPNSPILTQGSLSGSLGYPTQIIVNPGGQLTGTVVGHVATQTVFDGTGIPADAMTGHSGELPTDRYARLCSEQGVQAAVIDATLVPAEKTTMGAQTIDTFGTLLQQVPDAMFALMFEARDQLSLVLRTKATLYNQAAALTLDMAQNQLSAALVPQDDDQLTRNDVTASRKSGSSYEAALTSGTMSTLPPPAGIGPYPYNYDLSLGDDSLLPDAAGWRLHVSTVDEPRYPRIPVNIRRFATLAPSIDMTNALLTIDIGDRLDVINPPGPEFPPDPISQIVQGYTEALGAFEHDITFNCSPASPWRVGIADDAVLGHADTDGSTLAGDYPLGTETTLKVATTGAAAGSPLWTTDAGDFPFDWNVGGERMTVTNITGASSPQTATVTRSVNGVVKGQTSGTDVRLWQPMILAM